MLRQIKDIQFQADKICSGSPTVVEIEEFAKYSLEIRGFIESNFDLLELN